MPCSGDKKSFSVASQRWYNKNPCSKHRISLPEARTHAASRSKSSYKRIILRRGINMRRKAMLRKVLCTCNCIPLGSTCETEGTLFGPTVCCHLMNSSWRVVNAASTVLPRLGAERLNAERDCGCFTIAYASHFCRKLYLVFFFGKSLGRL